MANPKTCKVQQVNADCYFCCHAKYCKVLFAAENDFDNKFVDDRDYS